MLAANKWTCAHWVSTSADLATRWGGLHVSTSDDMPTRCGGMVEHPL